MSWTLFGTFAIGVAIGFSMCYALVLSLGRGEAQPDAAQAVTPTEEPAAEPVSTFYERAAELEFAPDIWAGRHLFIAVEGTALNANGAAFLKKLRPGGVLLTRRKRPGSSRRLRKPWASGRVLPTCR